MNAPRKYRSKVIEQLLERKSTDPIPKKERKYNKDFIIGWFMGEIAWHKTIPTLIHHPCRSGNIISVSQEEIDMEKEYSDIWLKTKKELDWENYRKTAKIIEQKYLPKEVIHCFNGFVEINDDVLEGIESYLWNTDGCHYKCDGTRTQWIDEYFTKLTFIYV